MALGMFADTYNGVVSSFMTAPMCDLADFINRRMKSLLRCFFPSAHPGRKEYLRKEGWEREGETSEGEGNVVAPLNSRRTGRMVSPVLNAERG